MHYLTKKIILITAFFCISTLHAENLYSCNMNGVETTYHENDARRMQSLGADCRIMNTLEEITCSMKGVRVNYSRSEAEELLSLYPEATCQINDILFVAISVRSQNSKPMRLKKEVIIYFPVNGKNLSSSNREKIKVFSGLHRNMGHNFTITGYASATGSSATNHTLSLQRAGIVRNALLVDGVNEDNIISVDALGEESLRYNTKYEERGNRAVVVKVFGR